MFTLRREFRELIASQRSNVRDDYVPRDIEVYVKSVVVTLSASWPYSELGATTRLYRDLGWNQETVGELRGTLEQVFGLELPGLEFICARSLNDVFEIVKRRLRCDGRMPTPLPAA